jgi:hypothetical protein
MRRTKAGTCGGSAAKRDNALGSQPAGWLRRRRRRRASVREAASGCVHLEELGSEEAREVVALVPLQLDVRHARLPVAFNLLGLDALPLSLSVRVRAGVRQMMLTAERYPKRGAQRTRCGGTGGRRRPVSMMSLQRRAWVSNAWVSTQRACSGRTETPVLRAVVELHVDGGGDPAQRPQRAARHGARLAAWRSARTRLRCRWRRGTCAQPGPARRTDDAATRGPEVMLRGYSVSWRVHAPPARRWRQRTILDGGTRVLASQHQGVGGVDGRQRHSEHNLTPVAGAVGVENARPQTLKAGAARCGPDLHQRVQRGGEVRYPGGDDGVCRQQLVARGLLRALLPAICHARVKREESRARGQPHRCPAPRIVSDRHRIPQRLDKQERCLHASHAQT